MADINPTFSVYHSTLIEPSNSICAVIGNFLGTRKSQEIVRCTQSTIELWKFSKATNEFVRIHLQKAYCNIRKISAIKTPESNKDCVVITSDSGTLSVVEFDVEKRRFVQAVNETFYKTGIRRLSPGQYVAVDPKGRAMMLAAIERNKLVYGMNRDHITDKLNVSSPVEANRQGILTYDLIAMDVGYENPIFPAIETDYTSLSPEKRLNYYEFDLGLNHTILKDTEIINDTANHLIAIPGGFDGPSGVLVCYEGFLQYRCPFKPPHNIPLPVRKDNNDEKSVIVCSVVHRMKNSFFLLIQNQFGDIFNVTLEYATTQETEYDEIGKEVGPGMVTCVNLRYFDTIPVCSSMVILKSGFMFADCEHGDQYIYQFEKLGTGPAETQWKSQDYPDLQSIFEEDVKNLEFEVKTFDNISLLAVNESLNSLMDLKILNSQNNVSNSIPELYSITGTGPRSALKIIHKSLPLTEIVTQELPSKILNSFICKIHQSDEFDQLIVLSFFDGSIILKIGEDVEEFENSGFLDDVSTLAVKQIGKSSIVQIHSNGLKQIFYSENNEPVNSFDWSPPAGIEILKSAFTSSQVLLALSNGDVIYFETSNESDSLVEYSKPKEFNSSITSISVTDIPKGRLRSLHGIIGCKDGSIHVISLDPKNMFKTTFTDKLPSAATSITNTTYPNVSSENSEHNLKTVSTFVHFGLQNGIYMRFVLTSDGSLEQLKSKYIASSPLNISTVNIKGKNNDLVTFPVINSTRSFIVLPDDHNEIKLLPLPIPEKVVEIEEAEEEAPEERSEIAKSYTNIISIHSNDVPQGLLLSHGDRLTISSIPIFADINNVSLENFSSAVFDKFKNFKNFENILLRYTPRTMVNSNEYKMNYIGCYDINIQTVFGGDESSTKEGGSSDEIVTYGNIEDSKIKEFEEIQGFGYSFKSGKIGSCLHVFSNENSEIGQTIELLDNQAIVKLGLATLEHNGEINDYLLVGVMKDFDPLSSSKGESYIRVYRVEEDGSLHYLYKHQFANPILAITEFQGRFLLGFGRELGIFELGKYQLLQKSGIKLDAYGISRITDIQTSGFRLFVSDISSSVAVLNFEPSKNEFKFLKNDSINRSVTRSLVLDHDTIIYGDKFGSLSVARYPEFNNDSKLNSIMNFYVGDVITSINKGKIGINGEEVIIYSGINGTVGVISSMKTMKETNFFRELEKLMMKVFQAMSILDAGADSDENINFDETLMIVDRDILKYRSYYIPKKGCIDGDLIEEFFTLPQYHKDNISRKMERSVQYIENKIIEMKNRVNY